MNVDIYNVSTFKNKLICELAIIHCISLGNNFTLSLLKSKKKPWSIKYIGHNCFGRVDKSKINLENNNQLHNFFYLFTNYDIILNVYRKKL